MGMNNQQAVTTLALRGISKNYTVRTVQYFLDTACGDFEWKRYNFLYLPRRGHSHSGLAIVNFIDAQSCATCEWRLRLLQSEGAMSGIKSIGESYIQGFAQNLAYYAALVSEDARDASHVLVLVPALMRSVQIVMIGDLTAQLGWFDDAAARVMLSFFPAQAFHVPEFQRMRKLSRFDAISGCKGLCSRFDLDGHWNIPPVARQPIDSRHSGSTQISMLFPHPYTGADMVWLSDVRHHPRLSLLHPVSMQHARKEKAAGALRQNVVSPEEMLTSSRVEKLRIGRKLGLTCGLLVTRSYTGQIQILEAWYGHPSDPSRRIDVSARVSEFLRGPGPMGAGLANLVREGCYRGDQVRLEATSSFWGQDPAPFVWKKLTVRYRSPSH
ncbi:ribBA [Symbiodinium sp. CCMP2592]|nr:ribBA [Symbiodinium sp. CCMP2592]